MVMSIPLTSNACLAHYRGGYVIAMCGDCRHERDIKVEALARLVGWDTKLRNCLKRFRCSACAGRNVVLSFAYGQKPRGRLKNPS